MDYEKIKKEFIVNSKEYSKEKLSELMGKLVNFAKVGDKGEVVVLKKIPTRKILKLIISAKFIAHEVENSIPADVSKRDWKLTSG